MESVINFQNFVKVQTADEKCKIKISSKIVQLVYITCNSY